MLRFRSLASGSSGNATLVEAFDGLQSVRVLVDCGLGLRQLAECLAQDQRTPKDIDAIFLTHEHGDHLGCALSLARRHRIPIWTGTGTASALMLEEEDRALLCLARDGEPIAIGALQLQPFTVPHDAREPLQLTCTDGDRVLGILTDLGHATPHVLTALAGCHALMLEANHDPDMLARSSYPAMIKSRIASALGHLSNAQAGALLALLRHDRLSTVIAAHLSERNNQPGLACQALAQALGCKPSDILASGRQGLGWMRA